MPIARFFVMGSAIVLAALAWRDAAVAFWFRDPTAAPSLLHAETQLALARLDTPLPSPSGVSRRDRGAVMTAARNSLRHEPLDAVAVRQFALADDRAGDGIRTSMLRLAERISRRDIATQIALLEREAANGDYPAALDHLDKALTVRPELGAAIYPQLAALIAAPDFRRSLVRFTARRWFMGLLTEAATKAQDPNDVAALMIASRIVLSLEIANFLPTILHRLIEQGNYAGARQLAESVGRGRGSAGFDDFRFSETSSDPRFAPLTWRIASSDSVQTQLITGGGLAVEVQPGRSALVADRVMQMAPGDYELEQKLGANDTASTRLEWLVACKGETGAERLLWEQYLPTSANGSSSRARLKIPADCRVQHWQLRALADDRQTSGSVRLAGIMLHPL